MNKRMITALCVALLGVARGIDAGNVCGTESSRKENKKKKDREKLYSDFHGKGDTQKYDCQKLNSDLQMYVLGIQGHRFYPELATIKDLVDEGADPNVKMSGESTLLIEAVQVADPLVVEQLVLAGADVNATGGGNLKITALYRCISNSKMVKVLLRHEANPDGLGQYFVPLHKAIDDFGYYSKSSYESASLLLIGGANVHKKNSSNQTPVQCALCKHDQKYKQKMIDLLAEYGGLVKE